MAVAACKSHCSWRRTDSRRCTTSPAASTPGQGRSIRRCRSIEMKRSSVLALLLAVAFPAAAEDLLQVYRDSQRYDATYSAARNNLAAGRERLPQGRALLLPTLNLTANATH